MNRTWVVVLGALVLAGCASASMTSSPSASADLKNPTGQSVGRAVLTETSEGLFSGRISISGVERWWPHTHGEPALYVARISANVPPSRMTSPWMTTSCTNSATTCQSTTSATRKPIFLKIRIG